MKFFFTSFLLLFVMFSSVVASDLPFVIEEVDQIIVLSRENSDIQHVIFIKNNCILATRIVTEEMYWSERDDNFQLIWRDYWTADRIVETKKLSFFEAEEYGLGIQDTQPWWGMLRNMRDLKMP